MRAGCSFLMRTSNKRIRYPQRHKNVDLLNTYESQQLTQSIKLQEGYSYSWNSLQHRCKQLDTASENPRALKGFCLFIILQRKKKRGKKKQVLEVCQGLGTKVQSLSECTYCKSRIKPRRLSPGEWLQWEKTDEHLREVIKQQSHKHSVTHHNV